MLRSFTARAPTALPRASGLRLLRGLATATNITRDTAELDQITTLPNGIRVATEALPGHFSGLGVYIDAGSRYENDHLRGVSHLVDRLAFKSTKSRSAEHMLETLESLGGNVLCASSRETIMYQAAVFNKDVGNMMGILAETVRDPLITSEEVDQQLETAAYEIREIWAKPELILPELLHMTAFQKNTLGNPLLCPEDRLAHINREVIEDYRSVFYRPERLVVALAGVEHEEAVKLAEKYFGDMPTTPQTPQTPTAPLGPLSKLPFVSSGASAPLGTTTPAHYTGGMTAIPPSDIPTHLPQYCHMHIAFEGLPISDPDIYALATLQTLLGGGGSFSAGGPGKGMYSRLYTNVLNQYGWIESAVAFNHSYTDSGLFGIAASCHPDAGHALINVVLQELRNLLANNYSGLKEDEVNRAKNQLRSSLLMNLESRMVELEDLGRQVQVYGRKISAIEMSEKINKLTVQDIKNVAQRVLKGKGGPTIIVQGKDESIKAMGDLLKSVQKFNLGR
ncbi:peptidase M16 inactive domain-containing protein [Sphaerosporella brunnea]|uniref:Mitochondrial-processing peptidase subunit alpha n=1 Tax=Sphaerosporella brunnea TaxID=1250544 RepID=A0A5J5F1H6_9PEZI|nr:peptidase M16 inactive domain-containing protein [Sphaerosporella brunnea]